MRSWLACWDWWPTVPDVSAVSRVATGRNAVSLLLRMTYRLRMTGTHHVPTRGGVILAANHLGLLDGPALFAASPRPVHVMSKSELFDGPWASAFRAMRQIPIDNESPDRSALLAALSVLSDNEVVGMFPESRRGRGDVSHMRHGVAYLALRSGVPVVPVAILGTRETGAGRESVPAPRSTIHVVFGEPMSFPVGPAPYRRAAVGNAGELLRQRLADHVLEAVARTGQPLPSDDLTRESDQDSPARPRSHRPRSHRRPKP